MKKKNIKVLPLAIAALLVVFIYVLASGGVTRNVERNLGNTDLAAQAGALATPVAYYNSGDLTCNSLKLRWNAVPNAKGYEVYGPGSVCNVNGSVGYCGKASRTTLSKTITGLSPNTTYSGVAIQPPTLMEGFTVLAYRNSSYSQPSARVNITTPSCGGGSQPTVSITSPSSNGAFSTSSPTVSLGGTATNASSVKWSLNGGAQQFAAGISSWSVSSISLVPNSANTVVVTAYDSSNTASAPATIVITHVGAPTDTIAPTTTTAPPASAWANTNILRTLTCTDNVGGSGCATTHWKFVTTGTSCGTSGYTAGTTATTTVAGSHKLCYYSVDNAGNTESVQSKEPYNLDPTAPSVNLTAPTSGQAASGTITLAATAVDNESGVMSVSFYIDGGIVSSDSTAPYSFAWNSGSVSNGTHTATAIATNGSGLTTNSSVVSFTVSNSTGGLATPTNLQATGITSTSFTLTWNPVPGASGYEVYGPLGCNGAVASSDYCGSSSTNSKLISGLSSGANYNFNGPNNALSAFTVLAYNSSSTYSSPATRLPVQMLTGSNSAPSIVITSPTSNPTYTSASSTITLGGTASDDVSVSSVSWTNQSTGASGAAFGTSTWSTPAITLQSGTNTIVVTATDGAGLTASDNITVTYGSISSALPWPASNSGTQIGGGLTSLFEPSGAFWNPVDQMLYFASDHGMVTKMDQNGSNVTNFTVSANLEGITGTGANPSYPASMDRLYVIDEDTSRIIEISMSGAITKTWTLPSNVTAELNPGANLGAEGIAWVPNGSHPYANSTSGGLFYIGSQMNGKVMAVDVPLSGPSITLPTSSLKGTIQPNLLTPGTPNIADLSYAPSTNKLFVLYAGLGIIHEMRPNGLFVSEYRLPTVPGTSPQTEEGIATIPTCNSTQTTIVLGYDPAVQHNVYKFTNYPQPCVDGVGPVITNNIVAPTSGSATVTWDTDEYSDSKIEFGPTTSYGFTINSLTLKTTNHSLTLSGLTPGATYQYRITSKDQAGNSSQKTGNFLMTGTGGGTSYTIVAAGDIACGASNCNPAQTASWIQNRIGTIHSVLALGDLAYDHGTLSQFNGTFNSTWGQFKAKIKPAPGNHEYYTSGAAGYFDYFNGVGVQTGQAGTRGQGYYSYNIGNWHIVALNSNDGDCDSSSPVKCHAGSPQEQWLRSDLIANPTQCSIAYMHHPRFSSGTGHYSYPEMQALWKAFEDNGGDIMLNGHVHSYERFAPQKSNSSSSSTGTYHPNGVVQFIVGTGGAGRTSSGSAITNSLVRRSSEWGVLKLVLHPTSYDFEFVNTANNQVLDSGYGIPCN